LFVLIFIFQMTESWFLRHLNNLDIDFINFSGDVFPSNA